MVLVNYAGKEINAKLVYYGPGLSGKTTNLEYIYTSVPATHRGKMVSMKTKTERTLFFDFLPLDLGELGGYHTRFLLYTVPGQVYYNATRKLVLKGVDAVVFVADSKRAKMDENRESLQNLRDNLKELGLDLDQVPWVLQYNKRDLPDAASIEELNRALNVEGVPAILAVASRGDGVFDTFREVSKLLLRNLSKNLGPSVLAKPAVRPAAQAPAAPRAAAPGRVEAPLRVIMPPHAVVDPPRVFAEPPRAAVETPKAAPPPVEREVPRVEVVTMRSEMESAPQLQPEVRSIELPRVEPVEVAPRFIVSDPPMRTEAQAEHAFTPTIEPVRASEPAEPPVLHDMAAEIAPEPVGPATPEVTSVQGSPVSRKENGKSENGRSKGGFFGWLRRPKNGQEIEPQFSQPEETYVVPSVNSGPLDTPPEIGEGEDLLTATEPVPVVDAEPAVEIPAEPFMEMAMEPAAVAEAAPVMEPATEPEMAGREARPHLELLRGTGEAGGASRPEAEAAFTAPIHEITVPVVLPPDCGEVRLVVRLLVSRTTQAPEALESGYEEPRAVRAG